MIVAVSWSALEPGNVAHEVGRGQLRVAFCCVGWFMLLLRDRNGGAGGGGGRAGAWGVWFSVVFWLWESGA